jgi:hypothetical protein
VSIIEISSTRVSASISVWSDRDSPGMQGLFVQGSRADRVDPTGHGEFRGCLDGRKTAAPAIRDSLPQGRSGDEAEIDAIDDTIFEHRRLNFGRRHDPYGERTPTMRPGPQPPPRRSPEGGSARRLGGRDSS